MKSIFKTSIAVVLVAAMTLTGCASSKKTAKDVVVAEVNGEKIYKSKVIAQYNNQKSNLGITTENENSDEYKDTVKGLKSSVLESLIYQNLIMQNANKSGLKVTDALLAE
jgi:ABC-type glycerol-3-phosphate transport system substrate-binding protein